MRYLLDTNTCIDLMRGHPSVVARVGLTLPEDCVISTVTSFELLTGVAKCSQPARERAKVELLPGMLVELSFDRIASERTAEIRGALEKAGTKIGPYDVLLAGQAVSRGLVLVTSNVGEFRRVPSLSVENWRDERLPSGRAA